jgi:colanic acid biosynthesis glycosyl transferase WcaI
MHFVLINQCFHPDTASTGQILHDLAQYLIAQGHKVTVVTSRQRYGTDQLLDVGDETNGNLTIHRLRGTAFGKKTLPGRVADFASFYVLSFRKLLSLTDADAWVVLTSPPMIGVFARFAAEIGRLQGNPPPRLFHWVMDLYPEATEAHGMLKPTHPVYRLSHALMRWAFRGSAGLIALGTDMKDLILRGHPRLPAERIQVIQPWADGSSLTPIDRHANPLAVELGLADTFNLVYSGNLGLAHDLDTFLSAIEATRSDPTLRWVFIGSGKRYDVLKEKHAAANWPHVRLLPFMPREKLTQSLGLADVHLLSQLPQFTGVVVPSKLFGIMAAGRPALMVGPSDCECARVIARHDIGLTVDCGDTTGLLAAIARLRDGDYARQAGARARKAFEAHYDRPVCCSRIEAMLSQA